MDSLITAAARALAPLPTGHDTWGPSNPTPGVSDVRALSAEHSFQSCRERQLFFRPCGRCLLRGLATEGRQSAFGSCVRLRQQTLLGHL